MERRREQRSAHDVWTEHYRMARVCMTRVNPRTPMNRAEQRITLVIWIVSICIAMLAFSRIFELASWLIYALYEANR